MTPLFYPSRSSSLRATPHPTLTSSPIPASLRYSYPLPCIPDLNCSKPLCILESADAAADFIATGVGIVGGFISKRFTVTHAIEAHCMVLCAYPFIPGAPYSPIPSIFYSQIPGTPCSPIARYSVLTNNKNSVLTHSRVLCS